MGEILLGATGSVTIRQTKQLSVKIDNELRITYQNLATVSINCSQFYFLLTVGKIVIL